MSKKNEKTNLIAERLKAMNEQKDKLNTDKPNIVQTIATGKEETIDFEKMAMIMEEKQKNEQKGSVNDGFVKDTIYIRKDLSNALNALCVQQGDKKRLVNQMYEEFLTKKYKELQIDFKIDN